MRDPGASVDAEGQHAFGRDRCASVGPEGDCRAEPLGRTKPPPMPREALRTTSLDGALSFRLQGGEREPKGARGTLLRRDKPIRTAGGRGKSRRIATRCSTPTAGRSRSSTRQRPRSLNKELVRQGAEEDPMRLVPWLDGDDVILVYGAPFAGDVVRIDSKTRTFRGWSPAACDTTESSRWRPTARVSESSRTCHRLQQKLDEEANDGEPQGSGAQPGGRSGPPADTADAARRQLPPV